MARRRMIDPNIWESEDVAKLTIRQRLLLIGLFSNADDYGKGRAKPAYVRSTVFPYDDISVSEIEEDLQAIASCIAIQFYEVDGQSYYKFTNWRKWQTVNKPQPSLIPEPSETQEDEREEASDTNEKNDYGIIPNSARNHSQPIPERFQNDSRLKEKKRKEEKRKKDNECAREGDSEPENKSPLATGHGMSVCPSDFIMEDIGKRYQEKIGIMNPVDEQKLAEWVEMGMSPSLVAEAIDRAAAAGKKRVNYVEGILKNWYNDGHRTLNDLMKAEQKREQAKAEKQNGREPPGGGGVPNASAYKPVDPEAVRRWKEMHPDDYG